MATKLRTHLETQKRKLELRIAEDTAALKMIDDVLRRHPRERQVKEEAPKRARKRPNGSVQGVILKALRAPKTAAQLRETTGLESQAVHNGLWALSKAGKVKKEAQEKGPSLYSRA